MSLIPGSMVDASSDLHTATAVHTLAHMVHTQRRNNQWLKLCFSELILNIALQKQEFTLTQRQVSKLFSMSNDYKLPSRLSHQSEWLRSETQGRNIKTVARNFRGEESEHRLVSLILGSINMDSLLETLWFINWKAVGRVSSPGFLLSSYDYSFLFPLCIF